MAFFDTSLHNTALIELSQVKRLFFFQWQVWIRKIWVGEQVRYSTKIQYLFMIGGIKTLIHYDLLYDVGEIIYLNCMLGI